MLFLKSKYTSIEKIQLMFSDNQAKKFVGKKWRIALLVTKFFTNNLFLPTRFYADFFPSNKVVE